MLSPGDFLVGRGAVASSHHFKPTFYRSADPVHVSPCFGAPSCFVCLAEVALSQDEVGSFRIGAAPGEGDEGPKTQRVDMTKADLRRGGGPRVAAPNHFMYVFMHFHFLGNFVLFSHISSNSLP